MQTGRRQMVEERDISGTGEGIGIELLYACNLTTNNFVIS